MSKESDPYTLADVHHAVAILEALAIHHGACSSCGEPYWLVGPEGIATPPAGGLCGKCLAPPPPPDTNEFYLVKIRHPDGEVREFGTFWPDAGGVIYMYTDGNFGCDCNRALQWAQADASVDWEWAWDVPCGESWGVEVWNPRTGEQLV